MKSGDLELASSYMLRFEKEQNPYEIRRQAIAEFVRGHTAVYVDYDKMDEVAIEAKAIMNREKFDYTKWQRNLFEEMTLEEMDASAAQYSKKNPL